MKDVSVGQELYITRIEDHVQSKFRTGLLEDLQSVLLRIGERRDPSIRASIEACERGDVVGIQPGPDSSRTICIMFKEEDGGAIPRVCAFADFAFAVEVPVWGRQCFDDVRMRGLKIVENVVCRDDVRFATFEGFGYAEQPHEIGAIGVVILPTRMLVDAASSRAGTV